MSEWGPDDTDSSARFPVPGSGDKTTVINRPSPVLWESLRGVESNLHAFMIWDRALQRDVSLATINSHVSQGYRLLSWHIGYEINE